MAFVFNSQFDESTEQKMGAFFQTLSEKDRRRYAAMEAVKLGHGGIAYLETPAAKITTGPIYARRKSPIS